VSYTLGSTPPLPCQTFDMAHRPRGSLNRVSDNPRKKICYAGAAPPSDEHSPPEASVTRWPIGCEF
jgi:hypothetical protein